MKCPYCNSELLVDRDDIYFKCSGDHCVLGQIFLEKIIFYDLIDGKKAQDAIQRIKDVVHTALKREFNNELRDDVLYISRIITSTTQQDTKE